MWKRRPAATEKAPRKTHTPQFLSSTMFGSGITLFLRKQDFRYQEPNTQDRNAHSLNHSTAGMERSLPWMSLGAQNHHHTYLYHIIGRGGKRKSKKSAGKFGWSFDLERV